jgi:hypothetical protein
LGFLVENPYGEGEIKCRICSSIIDPTKTGTINCFECKSDTCPTCHEIEKRYGTKDCSNKHKMVFRIVKKVEEEAGLVVNVA